MSGKGRLWLAEVENTDARLARQQKRDAGTGSEERGAADDALLVDRLPKDSGERLL
jgi:hypothetical protein